MPTFNCASGRYDQVKRWRAKYPDKARHQDRIAKQLRRTPGLRESILTRDGCCLRCGATADLVIDHIKPVLQGGDNDPGNLQTLCRGCNTKKRGSIDRRRKPGDITAAVPRSRSVPAETFNRHEEC